MDTMLVPTSPAGVATSYELVTLPPSDVLRQQLQEVRRFQALVKELFVEGHDYGVIPGTGNKPTLFKPGSEKLIKLLGLADTYEVVERIEDWERPFFNYTVRCQLRSMTTGGIVSEGLGSCNGYESRYRYRWVWPNEVPEDLKPSLKFRTTRNGGKQYRVENDDVYSLVNTLLKMACKRAQMAAALSAGRLSDVFTQDLEDLVENGVIVESEPATPEGRRGPSASRPAPKGQEVEAIWDPNDERWVTWIKVSKLAKDHGLKVPGGLDKLPCPAPALSAATKALVDALSRAGVDVAALATSGREGQDAEDLADGRAAVDQEELAL